MFVIIFFHITIFNFERTLINVMSNTLKYNLYNTTVDTSCGFGLIWMFLMDADSRKHIFLKKEVLAETAT